MAFSASSRSKRRVRIDLGLIRGDVDQIVLLVRVVLKVVEFVEAPDAMVVDVLESVPAQGKRGGGVRERMLPVVFVEKGAILIGTAGRTSLQQPQK